MRVRAAEARDAHALHALMVALNRDQGDPTHLLTPRLVETAIIAHDTTIVIVAEDDDGTLIGYATAHPTYETGHAEHGLYVGDLYVVPARRHQGVARAILAALARAGHARGARHLWLTARESNTAAHAFYRRLGAHGERMMAFAVVHQDFLNLAAEPPPATRARNAEPEA